MRKPLFAALLILLSMSAQAQQAKRVTGAKVTDVQLADGKATITVTNLSGHDISDFSIWITVHHADGTRTSQGRTEDYGPSTITNQAFRAGDKTEEVVPVSADTQKVEAEVIVAIYDNQTAEVKDDQTFRDTVRVRKGMAHALQLAADTLKTAASDPAPHVRAQQDLQAALDEAKAGKSDANKGMLQSEINAVKTAPAGHEQEFIQAEADRLALRAAAFTQQAEIRRLP